MGIGGLVVGLRLTHLPMDSNVSDISYVYNSQRNLQSSWFSRSLPLSKIPVIGVLFVGGLCAGGEVASDTEESR